MAGKGNDPVVVSIVRSADLDASVVVNTVSLKDAPPIVFDSILDWLDNKNRSFMDTISEAPFCGAESFLIDPDTGEISKSSRSLVVDEFMPAVLKWINEHRGEIDLPLALEYRYQLDRRAFLKVLICPIKLGTRVIYSVLSFE